MTALSQAPYPHSNFSQLSRQNQTFFDIFSLNTQGKLSLYDPRELRLRRLESPLYPPPLSRPGDVLKILKTSLIFRRISHEMYLRLCDLCNSTLRATFSFFTKALTSYVKVKVR